MNYSLADYIKRMPKGYYINEKRLWLGSVYVDIDHIDNDLSKPLDYESAFKKMLEKLGK